MMHVTPAPPNRDPLLQPYVLRHLTLRNRLMSTSHEPYYSEDGMPKDLGRGVARQPAGVRQPAGL